MEATPIIKGLIILNWGGIITISGSIIGSIAGILWVTGRWIQSRFDRAIDKLDTRIQNEREAIQQQNSMIKQQNARIDQQNARSDELYKMFIDVVKENRRIRVNE